MKNLVGAVVVSCVLVLSLEAWRALSAGAGQRVGQAAAVGNGDVNGDGQIDISDPIWLLGWLFQGGPPPVACASSSVCNSAACSVTTIYGPVDSLEVHATPLAGTALVACVQGRDSPGDGGGGLFFWDASSTTADDQGTIIMPASGSGRWKRIYDGPLSVKWFGAGNGKQPEDAAAIRAALNAAPEGGTVDIPPGTYKLSTLVQANPGFGANLIAVRPGLKIRMAPQAVLVMGKPATMQWNHAAAIYIGADDVSVEGGVIRGDRSQAWSNFGIAVIGARDVKLEGVTLAAMNMDGVYLSAKEDPPQVFTPCRDILIRGCTFGVDPSNPSNPNQRNGRNGIAVIHVDGLMIEKCFVRGTEGDPGGGIRVEPNPDDRVHDVTIRGNNCTGSNYGISIAGGGEPAVPTDYRIGDIRIMDNTVFKNQSMNIFVNGAVNGFQVSGNECSASETSSGISIDHPSAINGEVTANRCHENAQDGIVVNRNCDAAKGCDPARGTRVSGNKCWRNGRNGISIAVPRDLQCTENYCYENGPPFSTPNGPQDVGNGIFLQGETNLLDSGDVIISNNIARGNRQMGISLLRANATEVIGNHCDGNGRHGLSLDTGLSVLISSNRCTGNSQEADGAYDGIHIEAPSTDIDIRGNICRKGGGLIQQGYGLSTHPGPPTTRVFDNDCREGGKTGSILYGSSVFTKSQNAE